jgi:hypothetical protein
VCGISGRNDVWFGTIKYGKKRESNLCGWKKHVLTTRAKANVVLALRFAREFVFIVKVFEREWDKSHATPSNI